MMLTALMSMIGAFIGTFIAVVWLFSQWDEEDMYDDDELDYYDH